MSMLIGRDGNALAIIARVSKAWRKHGREDVASEYRTLATQGDYNDLLNTSLHYCNEGVSPAQKARVGELLNHLAELDEDNRVDLLANLLYRLATNDEVLGTS